jgi:exodeoxyribonuclease-1
MSTSFFFYDLETSGVSPRDARIMQFAGQRTDMELQPIGDPVNVLIKLSDDVLPDPDAIVITGITPQQTISEGITEAEFLRLFHEQVAIPGTIFVGYNSVRFDDEFMRYIHYRNFYDPYEWQYTDEKSRWDLLDVVRMTRALRPDGIQWPVDADGKPTNRLELLTKLNGIDHEAAHDAMSDVHAVIGLSQLIRSKQPKLFEYLLSMRDKKAVAQLVSKPEPFIYSSGKYDGAFEKTTAVITVANHPKRQAALVFDLRYDPLEYATMSAGDMVAAWRRRRDEPGIRLPIKTLQFNRCPAVAPLAVLDTASQQRLNLDPKLIAQHAANIPKANLVPQLLEAIELMDAQQQTSFMTSQGDVDTQLYDGFFDGGTKSVLRAVRAAEPNDLQAEQFRFQDSRHTALLPRYKARNFISSLDADERMEWEAYRKDKLMSGGQSSRAAQYFKRLAEVATRPGLTAQQQYLLEELQLYGQSVLPVDEL